jgi:hypothetical protein
MRRIILPLVILVIIAGAFLSRADEADPKTVSIEELITRLGNSDFAEREKSAKTLQARGPSVLPALRKALKHQDAEVRRRVEELIPILEAVAAIAPKRVTLPAEKQPLSAILKEIEKQTGYTVEEDERNDDNRFAFEMKDVPFWEALERIRRETGCIIVERNSAGKFSLKKSKAKKPFVVTAEAFRLELIWLEEHRHMDFRDDAGKGNELGVHRHRVTTVGFSIQAEPRFVIVGVETPKVESAQDEDGRPFTVLPSRSNRDGGVILLQVPEGARTIKEVRGTISIQVAVARKNVVATENFLASRGTKFRVGNDTLEIIRAGENPNGYYLTIALPPKTGYDPCWSQRIHLEDAKGNRYNSKGGTGAFDFISWESPGVGPPVKVVVEDWTIQHHSIPFVFKDVPLP